MPCDCSPESKLIETDILHLNENDYAMLLRDMLKMNDMHNITEIGYSLLDTMKKSGFSEIQRTIFIKNMVLDYEKIFQF